MRKKFYFSLGCPIINYLRKFRNSYLEYLEVQLSRLALKYYMNSDFCDIEKIYFFQHLRSTRLNRNSWFWFDIVTLTDEATKKYIASETKEVYFGIV